MKDFVSNITHLLKSTKLNLLIMNFDYQKLKTINLLVRKQNIFNSDFLLSRCVIK